jgi:glutamyl-tRNA reductase
MNTGNWQLFVCGATHESSSLEQREPLQLRGEEIARANALLGTIEGVMESAIVPTCNRIEFYFVAARGSDPFEIVSQFYRRFKELDLEPYRDLFRAERGKRVAQHLFRVSAGIDSMVLGENQILGQVKEAYSSACAVKTAGKVIHRLFHQAFRVGKRVRSDTEIGKGACSVSTAAVEMLSDTVRALDRPMIVFVGINQMIQLAAKRLAQVDGATLSFANRTAAKARAFAAGLSGVEAAGYGLEELPELIAAADIVISCTSAHEYVITREMVENAAAQRSKRRLVIVDLAIPRDVDAPLMPAGDRDPTVTVSDMEDVKRFVADRQHQRERAIPQAEEIIERKLDEFDYWYGHVQHEPIYNGANRAAESIREEELGPVIEKLPPDLKEELDRATRRLVDRLLKVAKRSSGDQSE